MSLNDNKIRVVWVVYWSKIIIFFAAYDQPAYKDNCFEIFDELENDLTYNEAKDHCENLNGTLINENKILDVEEVLNNFLTSDWNKQAFNL